MVEQILQRLSEHFDDGKFDVQGEGSHYDVLVVSRAFDGLRPVRRQQLVYAAVNELIRDGSVHAVNIKALTPDEAEG
ncbi:BolA/IbaG family iron-sulfur metabolism protein [Spongiibacter nanhainus]|uniref:BolA/IbaG family iron-sulfur metabolism protein n=1 Tax=Spongiibacter nanhainus TaxID=2794344 RepID=A0A7T4R248_9GAMM|nr:BolA/IbaG family iron-sulfur metabolism protein [Spongiibacter nanhainus]QQD19046.1 BolA/IbaG family iron-sulfur metabolism protein [Spongiibacter nanhainus]